MGRRRQFFLMIHNNHSTEQPLALQVIQKSLVAGLFVEPTITPPPQHNNRRSMCVHPLSVGTPLIDVQTAVHVDKAYHTDHTKVALRSREAGSTDGIFGNTDEYVFPSCRNRHFFCSIDEQGRLCPASHLGRRTLWESVLRVGRAPEHRLLGRAVYAGPALPPFSATSTIWLLRAVVGWAAVAGRD